jgi:hypothetical protein
LLQGYLSCWYIRNELLIVKLGQVGYILY